MKRPRKTSSGDYTVGYGKPPVDHRFKPGNTEHRKRSRQAAAPEGRLYRELLRAPVKATRNGNAVYTSRIELLIDTLVAAALHGDAGAAATLIRMHSRSQSIGELAPIILELSGSDWNA
jgi:hypothetical protein